MLRYQHAVLERNRQLADRMSDRVTRTLEGATHPEGTPRDADAHL